MGRKPIIDTHPQREAIVRAMAEGVPGVEISRRYGVPESAISRYKKFHFDPLSATLADDDTAPDDLLARLKELADSTRQSRKLADLTGSVSVRARAATAELAVLDRLIAKAGITDLSTVDLWTSTGALLRAVQSFVLAHPDSAPPLLEAMGAHPNLTETRDILRAQIRKQKSND